MANNNKKQNAKNHANKNNQTQKSKQLSIHEQNNEKKNVDSSSFYYRITPYILSFIGLFLLVCLVFPEETNFLGTLAVGLCGIMSYAAWAVPFILIINSLFWKKDVRANRVKTKNIVSIVFLVFVSAASNLITNYENTYNVVKLFKSGAAFESGGVIGGYLSNVLSLLGGRLGAGIITGVVLFILVFTLFNITPFDAAYFLWVKIHEILYDQRELKKRELPKRPVRDTEKETEISEKNKNQKSVDIPLDDDGDNIAHRDIKDMDLNKPDDDEKVLCGLFDLGKKKQPQEESVVLGNLADGIVNNPYADNEEDEGVKHTLPVVNQASEVEESLTQRAEKLSLKDIFTEDAVIASGGKMAQTGVLDGEKVRITDAGEIAREGLGDGEASDESIVATKTDIEVEDKPKIEEIYVYPDQDLLKNDPNPQIFEVNDELKMTALKLVETLTSFNVRTKIMNICCGPTVTRYELQPEIGIRVRSIQNLSDDIALHLAAPSVRIEAPIPGKDAVGIEIPNKSVSVVYIRKLIESKEFADLKSKLSVCLGMDVAGSPVYMDMAKMPHLLIAGATGMGKSVCINSFIVSFLYKARPDEVKLILIDPKKVELSMYNGIPHLLVPVVSDPKKAAGSLSWAVNEMERRFQLMEEVGMRNIKDYNEITKNDPEREFMPQIVIIIDELADLMMTARDSVESSICRLAQKARAAGMHLVIGTQRPSVDVITGLIKANVPSRIAFTVASQIDSRTIIDVSGAEKLLGNGDMLYAPVGCMKPTRVQGAYVSTKEVEKIVEFLKSNAKAEYDANIMESIEKEAANCGEKKKKIDFDDDGDGGNDLESDEMIIPAIGIAVDCGQISTSLLQRRLSLGYARAGRIIDKLEKMKIISPFEGSKPRKVLITPEEYMELKMRYEGKDGE